MADVFTTVKRSEVMSRIRGRGNKDTELAVVKLFRTNRIFGWRRHTLVRATVDSHWLRVEGRKARRRNSQQSTINSQLTVRPDFVFSKLRKVIFVDGCFWHGCPKHATKPKNNRVFWRRKLSANQQRDQNVNRTLQKAGWCVIRIWECELAKIKTLSTPHPGPPRSRQRGRSPSRAKDSAGVVRPALIFDVPGCSHARRFLHDRVL